LKSSSILLNLYSTFHIVPLKRFWIQCLSHLKIFHKLSFLYSGFFLGTIPPKDWLLGFWLTKLLRDCWAIFFWFKLIFEPSLISSSSRIELWNNPEEFFLTGLFSLPWIFYSLIEFGMIPFPFDFELPLVLANKGKLGLESILSS